MEIGVVKCKFCCIEFCKNYNYFVVEFLNRELKKKHSIVNYFIDELFFMKVKFSENLIKQSVYFIAKMEPIASQRPSL